MHISRVGTPVPPLTSPLAGGTSPAPASNESFAEEAVQALQQQPRGGGGGGGHGHGSKAAGLQAIDDIGARESLAIVRVKTTADRQAEIEKLQAEQEAAAATVHEKGDGEGQPDRDRRGDTGEEGDPA